jgi:integrase
MDDKGTILKDFLEFKKTTAHSKTGVVVYQFFVGKFLKSTKKPLEDITENEVVDFINKASKKYSIGSMNQLKVMLKCFIHWHYSDYSTRFRNLNKICSNQKKNNTYNSEQMLTKEDIEKLVQGETEPRWKAFWLLLFYGGFRPAEVCKLEWKNVLLNKEGAYIKVYVEKNHKEFEKFIPENVCFYLRKLQDNHSRYVFPRIRAHTGITKIPVGDMPIANNSPYQRLIPLARRTLGKHVNPYILRHSIATILYNRDDLKDDDVAQQMGHSKAMKQTYNNLSREKLRERMKKIYVQAEELPPEKKVELEKEMEIMKKEMKFLSEKYDDLAGSVALAESPNFGSISDEGMKPPVQYEIINQRKKK